MTKWYCVAPFKQVYIDNTGIASCCRLPREQTNLYQWDSHSSLKNLQSEFLQGNLPKVCNGCAVNETTFKTSLRTESNRDYNNTVYTETAIDFVDYRASNICNFKCRSCFPEFSHGIAQEVAQEVTLQKYYKSNDNKIKRVNVENFQWIIDNIDQINRLMFTGGEPTLMPEVKLMLEEVIKKSSGTNILITTNGSFTDDFWYDLPGRIPNLHWTLSIDAVGPSAEVVRHGTNWELLKHNAEWLAQKSTSLMINSVVTNLTVFHLWPLIKFANRLHKISNSNGCDHRLQNCTNPVHLQPNNLPEDLLPRATNYINECLALHLTDHQRDFLLGLQKEMYAAKFRPVNWKNFTTINSILDQRRGENCFELLTPTFDINI